MAICAVIFDLDGVLIDSAAAHRQSWINLGLELGLQVDAAAVAACFGRRNRDIVPILYGDNRDAQEVRRLGQRKEELYRELVRGQLPEMPGAPQLVAHYLHDGYQLAIGSSTPRANIDLALMEMGLTSAFKVVVSGDDVAIGKPHPAVFLEAARLLGLDPAQCMVIEDAPAGVAAARAAGMPVVALAGSYPVQKLRDAGRIIRHLEELIPKDAPKV